ncbi:MAG: hypothetical protein L0K65_07120 [Actinomyces sp.]|nr:hypothetical protein [Actinomyces sp.]
MMDLEERIARLIDPLPWGDLNPWDYGATPVQTHEERVTEAREETLAAARRVIDGLHLDIISSRHSLDGHRHRYDLSGFIREDA